MKPTTAFDARSARVIWRGELAVGLDGDGRCRIWRVAERQTELLHAFQATNFAMGGQAYQPLWTESGKRFLLGSAWGVSEWTANGECIQTLKPGSNIWGMVRCGERVILGLQGGELIGVDRNALNATLQFTETWPSEGEFATPLVADGAGYLTQTKLIDCYLTTWRDCSGAILGVSSPTPEMWNGFGVIGDLCLGSSWRDNLYCLDLTKGTSSIVGSGYVCARTASGLWSTALLRPEVGALTLWQRDGRELQRRGSLETRADVAPRRELAALQGAHLYPTARELMFVDVSATGDLKLLETRPLASELAVAVLSEDKTRVLCLHKSGELSLVT